MFEYAWRNHYIEPDDPLNNPNETKLEDCIEKIAPILHSNLLAHSMVPGQLFDVRNLYNHSIYSLCFGEYIPLHISARILDWVLFMNEDDTSLVVLLAAMIKICGQKILAMTDKSERFDYISKGKFIIECFENEAFFDELVRNYLTDFVEGL